MTSVVRSLRRRRHAATHGQRGFALLLALVLMAFFSVVVVALLGMTLNSAGVSTLQASSAKAQRAAESALDVSINKIRPDTTAGTYDPAGSNDCTPSMPSTLSIDGVDPTVSCKAKQAGGLHVPTDPTRSLTVIGTGSYDGTVAASVAEGGPTSLGVVGHAKVQGTTTGPIEVGGTYSQTGNCGAINPQLQAQVTCPGASLSDADQLPDQSDPSTLWSASGIAAKTPPVPTTCHDGDVVPLSEGAYPRAQTALLNSLIALCKATFQFAPGDYWFDADATGSHENGLVLSKEDATFVFGTPAATGGGCTGTANITLSPQTYLFHDKGSLTICGTVRQAADPPMPWNPPLTVANTGETGLCGHTTNTEFTNPDGATGTGAARAAFTFVGGNTADDCSYQDEASLMFTLPSIANAGPINSVLLHVTGSSTYANGRNAAVRIDVLPPVGSNTLCSVRYSHIPDARTTAVYDLLNPPAGLNPTPANCGTVIKNRSQLVGARLVLRYQAHGFVFDSNLDDPANVPNPCYRLDLSGRVIQACVEVDNVQLTVGWVLSADSIGAAQGGLPQFGAPDDAKQVDTRYADLAVSGSDGVRSYGASLKTFDFPFGDPYVPSVGFSGLGVLVTGRSDQWPIGTTPAPIAMRNNQPNQVFVVARIKIPTPSGPRTCGGMSYAIPLWDEAIYLNLVDPPSSIGDGTVACSLAGVTDARALRDAELVVEIRAANATSPLGIFSQVAHERINAVQLVASTANGQSYTSPDQTNTVAHGGNASFNVIGGYSTPHNDLKVKWTGAFSDPDRPMVDGSMVVHSIQSTQEPGPAGVICCEVGRPAERLVDLTAWVGPTKVARAEVRYSDYPDPGKAVTVQSWLICRTRPSGCQP